MSSTCATKMVRDSEQVIKQRTIPSHFLLVYFVGGKILINYKLIDIQIFNWEVHKSK